MIWMKTEVSPLFTTLCWCRHYFSEQMSTEPSNRSFKTNSQCEYLMCLKSREEAHSLQFYTWQHQLVTWPSCSPCSQNMAVRNADKLVWLSSSQGAQTTHRKTDTTQCHGLLPRYRYCTCDKNTIGTYNNLWGSWRESHNVIDFSSYLHEYMTDECANRESTQLELVHHYLHPT